MTKGDKLFGLKNIYKGIQFKSKLESKFAFLLDQANIKWKYEPQIFLLSNGEYYKPDFYLYELNTWVETKGKIAEHNKEFTRLFAKEINGEILLISEEESYWFSTKDFIDGLNQDNRVYLIFCKKCGSPYFCSNTGDWYCRHCLYGDGDHNKIFYEDFKLLNFEFIIKELKRIKKIEEKNGDCISGV